MFNQIWYEIASVILFPRKDSFYSSINGYFAKLLFLISIINNFVGIHQGPRLYGKHDAPRVCARVGVNIRPTRLFPHPGSQAPASPPGSQDLAASPGSQAPAWEPTFTC